MGYRCVSVSVSSFAIASILLSIALCLGIKVAHRVELRVLYSFTALDLGLGLIS